MLAKQAWRLLCYPSSLTCRVLQAKYFPRKSVLEAPLGHRPSHAWRSIREGASLLSSGLEWRVGNGQHINIWDDKWLPDSDLGHPKYKYPGTNAINLVSDLFSDSGYEWNSPLLYELFHEEDITRILSIRLSPSSRPDTIRWSHSDDGIYRVRSGYHVDFEKWWQSSNRSYTLRASNFSWSQLWQMPCPPRLRNFLWRAIDNNLPVRDNLQRRNLVEESSCPLCLSDSETIRHLFLTCPRSQTWLSSVQIDLGPYRGLSFSEACTKLFEDIGEITSRIRIVASIWAVWKTRNLIVFENEGVNFQREVDKAIKMGEEYLLANPRPSKQASPAAQGWRPPDVNCFKINTDAGLVLEGGGQVGAVVRDSSGCFVAGAIRRFPLINHPTLLEAHGCKMGIELAISLGLTNVIIESDCQIVVQALNHKREDRSDLAIIIEDTISSSASLQQVQFSFAHRSANQVAHAIAKIPCMFTSYPLILFQEPPSLVNALASDRM